MKKNKFSAIYDDDNWADDIEEEAEEVGGYPSEEDDLSEREFYRYHWYMYEE